MSIQKFFQSNGKDIVSIELKCISKQYIESLDQFQTGYSAQFRDKDEIVECIFLTNIIKSLDKIKEQYEIIQPQWKYKIENIVPFGKLSHQCKLKVIAETKFTILSQPDIRFTFENLVQEKYLQPEELDLIGVVKRVQVHRNKKVLRLVVGQVEKYQEVNLNLWDHYVNIEVEPFTVILAEKILFKKYIESFELNTTKQKSKIITYKDQVPIYLISCWENIETLKHKLIQEDIQNDFTNLQFKKVDTTYTQEKYNIICKITQIGPIMTIKDVKIAEAIIYEAVNNQQFQLSLFGNLINQVSLNHEYLITNVTKSQKHQNEFKTWVTQTRIIDLNQIDIVNDDLSFFRNQLCKMQNEVAKSFQITQVEPIKQQAFSLQRRPCLLEVCEIFQDEDQQSQHHTFVTKAYIMQIKANRFETKCSKCFKVTECCQVCKADLFIQTLVFSTISDFSLSLEVTMRESILFKFLNFQQIANDNLEELRNKFNDELNKKILYKEFLVTLEKKTNSTRIYLTQLQNINIEKEIQFQIEQLSLLQYKK